MGGSRYLDDVDVDACALPRCRRFDDGPEGSNDFALTADDFANVRLCNGKLQDECPSRLHGLDLDIVRVGYDSAG